MIFFKCQRNFGCPNIFCSWRKCQTSCKRHSQRLPSMHWTFEIHGYSMWWHCSVEWFGRVWKVWGRWEEYFLDKCPEANCKCREKPWKVRARTNGTHGQPIGRNFSGWRPAIAFLYLFLFHSLLCLTSFLSQYKNEYCASSTQPNPQLQNRRFIGEFNAFPIKKTTEDVDNGHSKECRSFAVDLHCNTFKILFWVVYTQACGDACRRDSHPAHAAAKRGHHRLVFFFFGPRKRGVRPHPPNPPWLRACLIPYSSMQAHHTTRGWLAVEWHLGVGGISLLNFCNAYSSLPGNNHCPLPGDIWEHLPVPCLGTFAVPAWDACQFPAWERLPVPCLGTLASSLPGNACQFPAWERLPVPCLGTLASSLPGNACQFPAWERLPVCMPCLGMLAVPAWDACQFPAWGRLPVPCLGTLASSLPGNVCQCPAWARIAVPAWDALPVLCLGTFANALPGHVCQSLPGNAICWDAVPSWALFLLSDKHEKRASVPFQAWNATHPCALLFCFCNERQRKRIQGQGKRTNSNQWRKWVVVWEWEDKKKG